MKALTAKRPWKIRYTPVVYGTARRLGLQDADAADVTQDVFRTVSAAISSFDCRPQAGSFRGWLMTVVRSRISDFRQASHNKTPGSGDTTILRQLAEQPADDDFEKYWEREYRRSTFDWAVGEIRDGFQENTWQAFWLTGVEAQAAAEVAEQLGMTEGAVYIAKCRVLAKLKEKVRELED